MDKTYIEAFGSATIRDKTTGEVLFEDNAIHLGNLAAAIVMALASDDNGHIRYMAFGNGGTRISTTGQILYRQPNVSNIRKTTDSLYNETFKKEITNVEGNKALASLSNSTYADVKILVTLDAVENGLIQNNIDRADSMFVEDDGSFSNIGQNDAVFDEIALYVGEAGIVGPLVDNPKASMITHLIFHPIQKSANRVLEIDYTIRIQLT